MHGRSQHARQVTACTAKGAHQHAPSAMHGRSQYNNCPTARSLEEHTLTVTPFNCNLRALTIPLLNQGTAPPHQSSSTCIRHSATTSQGHFLHLSRRPGTKCPWMSQAAHLYGLKADSGGILLRRFLWRKVGCSHHIGLCAVHITVHITASSGSQPFTPANTDLRTFLSNLMYHSLLHFIIDAATNCS
jgi:hypothetical protein